MPMPKNFPHPQYRVFCTSFRSEVSPKLSEKNVFSQPQLCAKLLRFSASSASNRGMNGRVRGWIPFQYADSGLFEHLCCFVASPTKVSLQNISRRSIKFRTTSTFNARVASRNQFLAQQCIIYSLLEMELLKRALCRYILHHCR